mgnify:CR=1 FL=1
MTYWAGAEEVREGNVKRTLDRLWELLKAAIKKTGKAGLAML